MDKAASFDQKKADDPVNHPGHYCVGNLECIEVMRSIHGDFAVGCFARCNAWKYLWRTNRKNGKQDIEKALWYLTKYNNELSNSTDEVKAAIRVLTSCAIKVGVRRSSGCGTESAEMELCKAFRRLHDLLGLSSDWNPVSGTLPSILGEDK